MNLAVASGLLLMARPTAETARPSVDWAADPESPAKISGREEKYLRRCDNGDHKEGCHTEGDLMNSVIRRPSAQDSLIEQTEKRVFFMRLQIGKDHNVVSVHLVVKD